MSSSSTTDPLVEDPDAATPLHLRRDGFGPAAEIVQVRDGTADGLLRMTGPLGTPVWLVTRYDGVREVLGDAERFANVSLPPLPGEHDGSDDRPGAAHRPGSLLMSNAPEHTRLRRMVAGEFTARRIRGLLPRITAIVDDRLDAMAAAGPPADLVASFAVPVPSSTICELLGVPDVDRAAFHERTLRELDVSRAVADRARATAESRAYLGELVDRARADPGDDVIGTLVRTHGAGTTRAELAGIAGALLLAGLETTANMISLGTLALLRAPEQLAIVRDEPSAVAPAVEELLRYLSVVHSGMPRVATRDTTIAGVPVAAGDQVVVSMPAADRDPALTADADTLDVTRPVTPHLAFGHGAHHCLGASLARAELAVALPRLLRRFPTLGLAVPDERVAFRSATVVHGLPTLPVIW